MFTIVTVIIFIWLLFKAVGLLISLTWGTAKIAAAVLIGLALPVLIMCLLFVGGIVLLAPLVMVAIAAWILKACL